MGEIAGPLKSVYQRTGDKNTKRYRLLKNSIIAERKQTLTMSNGHLIRKSGVAVKKSPATASKQSRKNVPKPPTPQDSLKKLAAKGPSYPAVQGRRFEQTNDTDSDDEDYQPLITQRTATGKKPASRTTVDDNLEVEKQQERANETQEKSNEASRQTEEAEKLTAERSNSGWKERANGGEIAKERPIDDRIGNEKGSMVQSTSGGGNSEEKEKSGGTAAKRAKKKRLVSYSSQESNSSIESARSRRSGRKHTTVTKMGAL